MSERNVVYTITEDRKKKCEKIINTAAIACGGVGTGFAQLPLADSAVITPIQIAMVVKIGKEFDLDLTDSGALAIIGGLAGAIAGRSVSACMLGWFPVVGNFVNAATAAGLTEVIGHLATKKFAEDINVEHKTIEAEEAEVEEA